MKTVRIMKSSLFIISLLVSTAFAGKPANQFKLIHVAELTNLVVNRTPDMFIFDANNESTRAKEGVIPEAKILKSFNKYDVATVLPEKKDATLVFYCANTQCTASHEAAKRAIKAGYTNVSVLADGIKGWKEAGQKSVPYKKGT